MQAHCAVRQLQQALATDAKALGRVLLNNNAAYTGKEKVAMDWAIHVMAGGVDVAGLQQDASAMDILHWGLQYTHTLKCTTCNEQHTLPAHRKKVLYL